MSELQLPELYPGWKTICKIGAGSFGTVYEIQRDLFGDIEKAALKHIRLPQNDSEVDELYGSGYDDASVTAHYKMCLANIVREYSMMAQIKGHSNVVSCDDVRYTPRTDGVGWDIMIRMELLTPMMKTLGAVYDEGQVVRLGRDISRALVSCQEQGIVHRDIKPQNIFVSKNGNYKLGDFGIARTMERNTCGTRIGTYTYMAPEVYHNQPYGAAADIYSLGLVLYWLMNERRMPFLPMPPQTPTMEHSEQARVRRLVGDPLPAPKNGSPGLKAIVLKACAFNQKDRFASARELLSALEQIRTTVPAAPVYTAPAAVPVETEVDKTWRIVPTMLENSAPTQRQTTASNTVRPIAPRSAAPVQQPRQTTAAPTAAPNTIRPTAPRSAVPVQQARQTAAVPTAVPNTIRPTAPRNAVPAQQPRQNAAAPVQAPAAPVRAVPDREMQPIPRKKKKFPLGLLIVVVFLLLAVALLAVALFGPYREKPDDPYRDPYQENETQYDWRDNFDEPLPDPEPEYEMPEVRSDSEAGIIYYRDSYVLGDSCPFDEINWDIDNDTKSLSVQPIGGTFSQGMTVYITYMDEYGDVLHALDTSDYRLYENGDTIWLQMDIDLDHGNYYVEFIDDDFSYCVELVYGTDS